MITTQEEYAEFHRGFKYHTNPLHDIIKGILQKNSDYKPSLTEHVISQYQFDEVTEEILNVIKLCTTVQNK